MSVDPERWNQIDRILRQVLSQLPENRKSFLNQACAGDKDLRREVCGGLLTSDIMLIDNFR